MKEISPLTKELIEKYGLLSVSQVDLPKIHVDEVVGRVAVFYERMRTIIDWKEEHLIRKSAIVRKLKARFFDIEIENFDAEEPMAESLVLELIRGGYLPNDKIPEFKILKVAKVIKKYILLLRNNEAYRASKTPLAFFDWLLEVLACEIEDALDPAIREKALMEYMFWNIKSQIKVSEKIYEKNLLKKADEDIQIYIAVCQALFKLDEASISFNLIRYRYPDWENAPEELMLEVAKNIVLIWQETKNDLTNKIANKFYAIVEKHDTPYLILGDILSSNESEKIHEICSNPDVLEAEIRKVYKKRLQLLDKKIVRAAVYLTLSIFLTKILLLVILEFIIDLLTHHGINLEILMADILLPSFLMFLIVFAIRKPSAKNLNIVIIETMKIVYPKEKSDMYEVKLIKRKNFTSRIISSGIYSILSVATFGIIYLVLSYFGFPLTSIIIDIIFIALILFAGTVISKRSQELTMEEEKENFVSFLSDMFFLPLQGFGKWMSLTWKQYNVITAIFNALIDLPFATFIEFLEGWRYFIKERKEDIR